MKARFQFGERVVARVMGREVCAEVLAQADGLVSVKILRCPQDDKHGLVGTVWAVSVERLRRLEESGNLFEELTVGRAWVRMLAANNTDV